MKRVDACEHDENLSTDETADNFAMMNVMNMKK